MNQQVQFFTPEGAPITEGIDLRPGQGYGVTEVWHTRAEYPGIVDERKIASCKFGHFIMFGGYRHELRAA